MRIDFIFKLCCCLALAGVGMTANAQPALLDCYTICPEDLNDDLLDSLEDQCRRDSSADYRHWVFLDRKIANLEIFCRITTCVDDASPINYYCHGVGPLEPEGGGGR